MRNYIALPAGSAIAPWDGCQALAGHPAALLPMPVGAILLLLVSHMGPIGTATQRPNTDMMSRMKQSAFALFLACLLTAGCRSHAVASMRSEAESKTAQTTGTGFDYYLLNLSWSPEYCYSHPSAVECAEHATFVLHGLWPENNDGTYPENCSNTPGPADTAQYQDLYPDPGLLNHEWRTHGTCSGLSADAFFTTARTAYRTLKIPPALENLKVQTSMTPEDILRLFTESNPNISRESFVLSCGNNYMTAIEVCLDKELRPISCQQVRRCRANKVRIPAP